jgi:hypothetical protein
VPKNLFSLSIDGMNLKLLACQDTKVLGWDITPLSPGLLKRGFPADPQRLANVIRTAASKAEFRGRRRVLASLASFYSVCRIMELPSLAGIRPEVTIPQQARRDMGYSAESSLLFWQPLKNGDGQRRFLVVSVPKEPVAILIETLKLAGLRPDKIETSIFALSRAVNRSQAIILAVDPHSLETVIMRDSIPLISRSEFAGETPWNLESLPSVVSDALERIIAFHNESNPDNPLPPDIPVYLLGSAVSLNPDIVSRVGATLGRPLAEFEPPILYPQDFPKAELAVNVGLVLKEL